MADTVNESITDAVTQTNVKVVAEAPAMAIGSLYQTMTHSTGLMFENAVSNQNLQTMTGQTTTIQGITQISSVDTIADAVAMAQLLKANNAPPTS